MPREDWAKIQIGIGELLASEFSSSEREEIASALAEAEAEFERNEGLSGEEMRRHFGLD